MPRNHSKNHPQLIRDEMVVSSSRHLDQKYGATAWLHRIFLSSLTGKSEITHYRGFARGARNEKLKKCTRIDERRRPALWAETRRLDQKNAGNYSNLLHFLFIFIYLFSHQTLQDEILFATYNNVFYYVIYC